MDHARKNMSLTLFFPSKDRKGGFYKTKCSLKLNFFLKMSHSSKYLYLQSLMRFSMVVVAHSQIVILPDNNIFNLKMRQITRVFAKKNVSMNENICLQLKLGQCLKKLSLC